MIQKVQAAGFVSGGNQEHADVVVKNNNTIDPPEKQEFIASILLARDATSADKPAPTPELIKAAGLSDSRALQALIEDERDRVPIVSGAKGGYWVADVNTPEGRADIARCATTLMRRGAKTIGTGRKLRRFLGVLPGQEVLGDSDGAEE
ncbi:MAG: hypothetical protein IJG40_16055 [Oscillospiraceae bacterium]|nr:hypothetical protein [Oscillospiraceae bacterium]